eukprot:403374303
MQKLLRPSIVLLSSKPLQSVVQQRQISRAFKLEKLINTWIFSQLRDGYVTMYLKSTCPALLDAEQLLESKKVPYKSIIYEESSSTNEIQEALEEFTHQPPGYCSPAIFIGNEYIGNFKDLQQSVKSGELFKKIKEMSSF